MFKNYTKRKKKHITKSYINCRKDKINHYYKWNISIFVSLNLCQKKKIFTLVGLRIENIITKNKNSHQVFDMIIFLFIYQKNVSNHENFNIRKLQGKKIKIKIYSISKYLIFLENAIYKQFTLMYINFFSPFVKFAVKKMQKSRNDRKKKSVNKKIILRSAE